jgi:hypothetical protein
MKQLMLGILIGVTLSALGATAGTFYDSSGAPSAPHGSVQQFDYFRERQAQLDIGAIRRGQEQDRIDSLTRPCGR